MEYEAGEFIDFYCLEGKNSAVVKRSWIVFPSFKSCPPCSTKHGVNFGQVSQYPGPLRAHF